MEEEDKLQAIADLLRQQNKMIAHLGMMISRFAIEFLIFGLCGIVGLVIWFFIR